MEFEHPVLHVNLLYVVYIFKYSLLVIQQCARHCSIQSECSDDQNVLTKLQSLMLQKIYLCICYINMWSTHERN